MLAGADCTRPAIRTASGGQPDSRTASAGQACAVREGQDLPTTRPREGRERTPRWESSSTGRTTPGAARRRRAAISGTCGPGAPPGSCSSGGSPPVRGGRSISGRPSNGADARPADRDTTRLSLAFAHTPARPTHGVIAAAAARANSRRPAHQRSPSTRAVALDRPANQPFGRCDQGRAGEGRERWGRRCA